MRKIDQSLSNLATAIREELSQLGVWSSTPLAAEKFNDMGAFGINTMSLTQWIQFVLLPRIQQIIDEQESLPSESMISAHAVREFDGNPEYDKLIELLTQLDDLANGESDSGRADDIKPILGVNVLPDSLRELAKLLHTFEGDFLESQLQTFDIMLPYLPDGGRSQVAGVMHQAAESATNFAVKTRLRKAAQDVLAGRNICKPYDHTAEMKKYQDEFKKGYPDLYPPEENNPQS